MKRSGGKEPESAKQLRARQILDLSRLDEQENERIKNLFIRRSGARAFRSSLRAADGAGASAAGAGVNAGAGAGRRSGNSGAYGGGGGFRRSRAQLV